MDDPDYTADIHDLDVSVWVGKGGVEAVVDELDAQLDDRELVKVRMLRAGRGEKSIDALAEELAEAVGGTVVDVRGHTVVIRR